MHLYAHDHVSISDILSDLDFCRCNLVFSEETVSLLSYPKLLTVSRLSSRWGWGESICSSISAKFFFPHLFSNSLPLICLVNFAPLILNRIWGPIDKKELKW